MIHDPAGCGYDTVCTHSLYSLVTPIIEVYSHEASRLSLCFCSPHCHYNLYNLNKSGSRITNYLFLLQCIFDRGYWQIRLVPSLVPFPRFYSVFSVWCLSCVLCCCKVLSSAVLVLLDCVVCQGDKGLLTYILFTIYFCAQKQVKWIFARFSCDTFSSSHLLNYQNFLSRRPQWLSLIWIKFIVLFYWPCCLK